MNRKDIKRKEFLALLDILINDGFTNKEVADAISITAPHLSKIKSGEKNATDKVLTRMKLLIYSNENYNFIIPDKEQIIEDVKSDLDEVVDERKYREFMSYLNLFYDLDYKDRQIAELINIRYAQFNLIKNRERNPSDEILIRLSFFYNKVMPEIHLKKKGYKEYLLENLRFEIEAENKEVLELLVEEVGNYYESIIYDLDKRYQNEVAELNKNIENLLFAIDKCRRGENI